MERECTGEGTSSLKNTEMAVPMSLAHAKLNICKISSVGSSSTRLPLKPARCTFLQEQVGDEGVIMCEPCNGKGWLVCDFCRGQKTNVKSDKNRIYRRCPSCRAIGYILCGKCKVYKCVTCPTDASVDGLDLTS